MQLTRLKASSLRGLPAEWPEVQIGERGLVVLGPNACGKSSIVDATEFALTNDSTLFAENRRGVNWENASQHVRGGQRRAEVIVKYQGQEYTITGGIATGIGAPEAVAKWAELARTSKFVLRRHMLLRFINAEPRHRYSQLEPFLKLDAYREVEAALSREADRAQLAVQQNAARLRGAEQVVRATFGIREPEPLTEARLIGVLNGLLRQLGIQEIAQIAETGRAKAAVAAELGSPEKQTRLGQLLALKAQIQGLELASNYRQLMDDLSRSRQALERELAGRREEVITDLLITARDIIQRRAENDCPVCEQPIERDAVLARLAERIAEDERITEAKAAVAARIGALRNPIRRLNERLQSIAGSWAALLGGDLPDPYRSAARLLREIEDELHDAITSERAGEFAARLAATPDTYQPLTDAIDRLIGQEGGGQRRDVLSSAMQLIDGLESSWKDCLAIKADAAAAARMRDVLSRLHGHAVEARKEVVQRTYDEVAALANEYYDFVHPGEGLGTSRLAVRPTEDGSVELFSTFHGIEAPPALYYSESHLDTLGLCYFLALRRREADKNPEFKLLVLDDVIHSVDAEHRVRVVDLLKAKFADHQIVITTHDDIFYARLRQAFGNARHVYVALNTWRIDRGPITGDPSTDLERVTSEEVRIAMAPNMLAAACGRFLEWLLREATEALQVAIPARFKAGHDIGSLWPAFSARLKRQAHFMAQHPALVGEIDANGWVRNEVGGHYNERPVPVAPAEVVRLAERLTDLYAALHCNVCGKFVAKLGDNDWRCSCGTVSYRAPVPPAAQPAARQSAQP